MQKDQFQFGGTQPAGAPLRGTSPLGGGGPRTRPLGPGALAVPDRQLVEKAASLLENLEQRVELLIRACEAGKLPMPGIVVPVYRFPLSGSSVQVLGYLVDVFAGDAKLAQAVQVAIYRYQEVTRAIRWRIPDMEPDLTDLEALRRKVFYLTNLSAEFRHDRILATLFPAPTTQTATLQTLQQTPEERQRVAEQREEILRKTYALGAALAPRMAIAALALDTLDKGLTANMRALLTPDGRTAKMIAVALTGDPKTTEMLKEAVAQFEALKEVLPQVRAGEIGLDALRPIALPLGQLAVTFAGHALLRDLFTRSKA